MAWDTEGTRRRLKEAAAAEFAEHGPDGTTMARIAERAGINKERLYKYFGDKQALFETVLTDELDKLAASVAPVPSGFEEIGEFAGRTFDYQAAHPQLVRLLLWEGRSGGVVGLRAAGRPHAHRRRRQRPGRARPASRQRGDRRRTAGPPAALTSQAGVQPCVATSKPAFWPGLRGVRWGAASGG